MTRHDRSARSPFPGMDPYLEEPGIWPDFHYRFVAHVGNLLNRILPERYATEIDRHIWRVPADDERLLIGRPDVHVSDLRPNRPQGSALLREPPARVTAETQEVPGQRFVSVLDVARHRVVTVIELLSPSNKNPGPMREGYLAKRGEYILNRLNIIELDFLRSGVRPPSKQPVDADYCVMVGRSEELPEMGCWKLSVRDALPVIPVPLDPGVPEVDLDLQSCFEEVYTAGRYRMKVDYSLPPVPPLADRDVTWAADRIAATCL